MVAGRYEFRLRVTDDQGEFDEDTVSLIVKPGQYILHFSNVSAMYPLLRFYPTASSTHEKVLKLLKYFSFGRIL